MALQLRRGTNAERLLITPQQGELIFVTDYLAVNITATTIASNLVTFSTNHNLTVGQKLLFVGITANNLIQNTVYYVLADGLTTTACKLSLTSAGAPVTLTNATGLTALFNKSPTNASGTPVNNVSPLWVGNGTTVGGVAAQTSVLDDLLDVTILNVAEGQTLYYDANTAQWKNTDILRINDATTGVEIYNTAGTRTRRTGTFTNQAQTVLTVSSASTGTPTAGFGSAIAIENEVRPDIYQVGAFITSSLTDVTAGSEDAKLSFQIQTAGSLTMPLLLEGYDATVSGNLYLKGDNTTDTYIDFVHPTKTARLAWDSSSLNINGNFDIAGTGNNGQVDITANKAGNTGIANIFNTSNIGTLNIGNGVTTELNLGSGNSGSRTLIKSPSTELFGDLLIGGNDIKTGTYNNATGKYDSQTTAITLSGSSVTVAGNLAVNGGSITTTAQTANLFNTNAVIVNLANAATALTMGSDSGTTTIRNNAIVTGDVTVSGGEIKINGVADGNNQPFLTFQTQLDNNTKMYGIRGKSATDDAWFIGSGSLGDDLGYLELATGDNAGGTNTGGQIYVRQYNNGANTGVPWEVGGTGTVVNELVLLDNLGNTLIPHTLTIGGDLIVNGTTTTVNSTTLTVDDKNIELGSVASPSNSTAAGGGITLLGGTGGDKTILWQNNFDSGTGGSWTGWESSEWLKVKGRLFATESLVALGDLTLGSQIGTTSIAGGNINTSGSVITFHNGIDNLTSPYNNPTQNVSIINYRGSQPDSRLTWNETVDRWQHSVDSTNYITMPNQNLDTTDSVTFNGVVIGKNALGDNDSNTISVAKGNDLTLQSGSTLALNSDLTALKRNTSRASSIVSNIIGTFNGNAHNFNINDRIQYLGASGNGLTQDAYYYVSATSFSTSTCRLANTFGGTPITLTGGSNLNLTFFSEGGINNAYFNTGSGQYAFNKETTSGLYNLEVEGTFNATSNAVIGGYLTVGDDIFSNGNLLQLNINQTGTPTISAGIEIERGDLANTNITWNESTDRWMFTNDGTNYTNLPVATDTPTYAGLNISNNTTSTLVGITGTLANSVNESDYWFVGGYAINGETNNGAMVIATANNGNEPIYVRQYTGGSTIQQGTIAKELTLLDSSGNTTLAGNLTVTGNTIRKSNGTDVITFSGTNLTTFAGGAVLTANLDVKGSEITNSTGLLQLTSSLNNHIKLTPNGTGNVLMEATTIQIGESTGAQLTTSSSDLRLDTNNSSNSGYINITAGVNGDITLSPNGTGKVVVTANLAVNGGSITTTQTTANLFNTIATTINIGSSTANVAVAGTVTAGTVTVGATTDATTTTTVTQTTPVVATNTTRRGMKVLLNITDNVTKDVHMAELLITSKVVSGVGTVYMTTFGEVTSAGQLATFSADSNGTTLNFYVTPLSSNSTQIVCARKSIS